MSESTGETTVTEKREVRLKKTNRSVRGVIPCSGAAFYKLRSGCTGRGSVYIDVGVVPLDEILQSSSEATFMVLTRLVMSLETLNGLKDQISALLPKSENGEGHA